MAAAGLVYLISYLFSAYVFWRVGRKFRNEGYGWYCLPLYNLVLLCRCAGVSPWHIAALFIPIVNFGATIWIWGNVARRMDKSFWAYGLGSFFLIPVLVLAFGRAEPAHTARPNQKREPEPILPPAGPRLTLTCTSGEMAAAQVEIPEEGIVIGRDPNSAQLILSHPHVSGSHARISKVTINGGGPRLRLRDLGSTNGTQYREAASAAWATLKSNEAILSPECVIRIAGGVAEFRVDRE